MHSRIQIHTPYSQNQDWVLFWTPIQEMDVASWVRNNEIRKTQLAANVAAQAAATDQDIDLKPKITQYLPYKPHVMQEELQ